MQIKHLAQATRCPRCEWFATLLTYIGYVHKMDFG